jgi:hypothetical protein
MESLFFYTYKYVTRPNVHKNVASVEAVKTPPETHPTAQKTCRAFYSTLLTRIRGTNGESNNPSFICDDSRLGINSESCVRMSMKHPE